MGVSLFFVLVSTGSLCIALCIRRQGVNSESGESQPLVSGS
jgi:hypothetical protein